MNKIISKQIRKARIERGLTQQDLANCLGYKSANAISEIERNKVQISPGDLYKLSEYLKKPLLYFFNKEYSSKFEEEIIGLFEKMDPKLQKDFLAIAENTTMFQIIIKTVENTSDEERQKELLQDYLKSLNNYLIPINKIRNEGLELKAKIEKALGFDI